MKGYTLSDLGSMTLPIRCIRGRSGPHLQMFQTICPPSQLISLLGHDPRSSRWKGLPAPLRDAYEKYQRITKPARAEGIEKYIGERLSPNGTIVAGFPALSIGLTEPPVFEPLRSAAGVSLSEGVKLSDNVGTLWLDIGAKHTRMLLDGLARLTGAMEHIDAGVDVDQWFSFALTIFAPTMEHGPLSASDLGQLFHDYNYKVARISPTQALELDQAGLYSQIVEHLKVLPVIRDNGGMQPSGASLGKKSTALVVRRVLHGFTTIAAEGEKALRGTKTEEVRDPVTTQENLEAVAERIGDFLTRFAEAMGPRFADSDSIHLTRLGWEAIGMIVNDTVFQRQLGEPDLDQIVSKLAAVDWSRTNKDWIPMIGMPELGSDRQPVLENGLPKVVITGGKGDMGLKKLIDYLRGKVGIKPTRRVSSGLFDEAEAA